MTDELLSVMNRRAAVGAVRAEAARAGLDADQLLDSRTLYDAVTALDPDGPDFSRRVRDLVGASAAPAARSVTPAAAPLPAQWTDEDVARSTPQELAAAQAAGLLTSMGCGPRRQRRRA